MEGEIGGRAPSSMLAYSPSATKFLAAKTLDAIARLLYGTNYADFRKVLYPQPRYRSFTISKRDGSDRQIDAPVRRIKRVQQRLAGILLEIYGAGRASVHGFAVDRSIVTNAEKHAGRKTFVLNLDLQNFFPSMHFGRVRGLFESWPFGFSRPIASVLAHICCYLGRLPQGAPTSPVISNFICRSMDSQFERLARVARATYTRYCDDITFSFTAKTADQLPPSVVKAAGPPVQLGDRLLGVLSSQTFTVNGQKTRLRGRSARQEVTGLTVNQFVNVRRDFVDQVRGMLHAWERYGLAAAQNQLPNHYHRQLASESIPRFERVLRGKLLFLRMVRGSEDPIFTKLAERFNALVATAGLTDTPALKVVRRAHGIADLARAVFIVESHLFGVEYNYVQGTAFYLEDVGFITCEHVLRRDDQVPVTYSNPANGDVLKILDESGTFELEVEVVSTHVTEDFAVLRPLTAVPVNVIPLRLGRITPNAGDAVRLVGFPAYSPGKTLSAITAKAINRYRKFGKEHFEIDHVIRKGNSGGPVLDSDLFVVGIAKEGATQAEGNNAVLSVVELRAALKL